MGSSERFSAQLTLIKEISVLLKTGLDNHQASEKKKALGAVSELVESCFQLSPLSGASMDKSVAGTVSNNIETANRALNQCLLTMHNKREIMNLHAKLMPLMSSSLYLVTVEQTA